MSLKRERDQLVAALEHQKPQKRRKIRPTAQERFVTMLDVKEVKESIRTGPHAGGAATASS